MCELLHFYAVISAYTFITNRVFTVFSVPSKSCWFFAETIVIKEYHIALMEVFAESTL